GLEESPRAQSRSGPANDRAENEAPPAGTAAPDHLPRPAGTDSSDTAAPEARMATRLDDRPENRPDPVELDRKFDQAVSLISHFEYARAEPILRPLVGQYRQLSKADKSALSMFWLAYSLEKQAQLDAATVLYREIIRMYDGSSAATQAARRLQQIEEESRS
ncbi:MAG: tetratricopeptide repeat protein, partial [Phycisphaerae bacterium]